MPDQRGRRDSGAGTIYPDRGPQGGWRAAYVDAAGVRRYLRRKTRPAVVRALREALDARDAGVQRPGARDGLTVAAWLEQWLDTVAARKVKVTTLPGYRQKMQDHVIPHIGDVPLDRLQPDHLDALYQRLHDEDGLAPASVQQIHRILSRALKVAWQRGKTPRHVGSMVDAPTVTRDEVQPLTLAQARAVLDVAADPTYREGARWTVALALGLRQGEALGLTRDDVDLDAARLWIRRELARVRPSHGCPRPTACGPVAACPDRKPGYLALLPVKSKASKAPLPIPPALVEQLREHLAEQDAERAEAGDRWTGWTWDGRPVDLLFRRRGGTPWDPSADNARWHRLLDEAGVDAARLHDARHTCASLLLAQGVPLKVVSEILRHSGIAITADIYGHVTAEVAHDAATVLGDALFPAGAADPESAAPAAGRGGIGSSRRQQTVSRRDTKGRSRGHLKAL